MRNNKLSRRAVMLGGLLLCGAAITPGHADELVLPDYYPEAYHDIVEASKSEDGLTIYSSFNVPVWQPLQDAFQAKYPWISIDYLDLNPREAFERYMLESSGGARTADFLALNGPDVWYDLDARGQLIDYESPESDYLPDWTRPVPGAYAVSVDSTVLVWNKLLLTGDLVPTGFQDLVDKVAANPDVFAGKRLTTYLLNDTFPMLLHYSVIQRHGGEAGWKMYEALAANTRLEGGSGPMIEKLLSGEYLAAYFSTSSPVFSAMAKPQMQAILDWSFFQDGTPIMPRHMGIPAASKSVNSAKLLLDFLLSREGQVALAAAGRTPYRSDLTPESVEGKVTLQSMEKELGEEGLIRMQYDEAFRADASEFEARWNSLFK